MPCLGSRAGSLKGEGTRGAGFGIYSSWLGVVSILRYVRP